MICVMYFPLFYVFGGVDKRHLSGKGDPCTTPAGWTEGYVSSMPGYFVVASLLPSTYPLSDSYLSGCHNTCLSRGSTLQLFVAWSCSVRVGAVLQTRLSGIESDGVADAMGLDWWIVWYMFLLLISVGTTAAVGKLKLYAPLLGNFLAALFAVLMGLCHEAAKLSRFWKDTV